MRIGMMADVYKPHVSGVTNYISSIKRNLEKRGHEVLIFTFGDKELIDDKFNIIRSQGLPLRPSKGYPEIYLGFKLSSQAQRILRTIDVAHVHHPFLSGLLALHYCKPYGIPILYTNHTRYDLYANSYMPFWLDGLGETFLKFYLPPFCQAVDLVLVPSPSMKEVLQKLGVKAEIEVVPHGVDLQLFQDCKQTLSKTHLEDVNNIALIYVGRLAPEKNLTFLIQAFSEVARTCENVNLILVGDGPERQKLENLAELMGVTHLVHFTGIVPNESLPQYLSRADIFVTASVSETFGLSVIEAMACGLPVAAIDSPGIKDIVIHGVTGFLSSEELPDFIGNMTQLIANDALRQKLGKQACRIAKGYSINVTSEYLVEKYVNLITDAKPKDVH
jgi:1,2-diacylglycerol 3-alpha-glucosyltransferase